MREVGGRGEARVSSRSQPVLDIVSNIRLEGEFGLGAPVEEVCEVLLEGKQCMVGAGGG